MAIKCGTFWDEGKVWPELAETDIRVENHGTIARLVGLTDAGKTFLLDELKGEGRHWLGDTLCVELGLVQDIIHGAQRHGLNVEVA